MQTKASQLFYHGATQQALNPRKQQIHLQMHNSETQGMLIVNNPPYPL